MIHEPSPKQLADADQDLANCSALLDAQVQRHRDIVNGYREHGIHGSTRPVGFHSSELLMSLAPPTMAALLSIALHRQATAAEAAEQESPHGDR
jgi:hypothetical protein